METILLEVVLFQSRILHHSRGIEFESASPVASLLNIQVRIKQHSVTKIIHLKIVNLVSPKAQAFVQQTGHWLS